MSDRGTHDFTLEQRMHDVQAILDAIGCKQAALFGVSEGGPMPLLYAATYPHRTSALVIYGSYVKRSWAPGYPFGWDAISTSAITRPRAVAGTITDTVVTTITGAIAGARTILPRTKHLLAVAAAEIHPIGDAGLQIVVTKMLLNIRIAVSNTLAMRRVVLPVVPDVA